MKITVTIEEQEYIVHTPVEYPDTEQFMFSVERVIKLLEYPPDEVEDYILDWADEIKTNRYGKD